MEVNIMQKTHTENRLNQAKNKITSLFRVLVNRWGLLLLGGILLAISSGIIKPEFYFLGWDNFSSYLNLESTVYNTAFDTWREHRGLGVPSDAEINDIFRQVFYALASFLGAPVQILDQIYFVLMLWGGVLGMYGLGRYISRRMGQDLGQQELFGFLAAFFYLFNLSTMSVFYYPMIMFVNRFFMLPTLVFVLLKLIDGGVKSKLEYLFMVLLVLVGFGTHMVPTNFIALCMALGLGFLILKHKKRVFVAMAFVLLLGMYWMLPFANYTLQKGDIVPNAPLFVLINEAMLNKPKEYYSFENQAKLRPNFFDIEFTQISDGEQLPFHELADSSESGRMQMLLWIFPVLYLAGIGYVLIFKRDRVLVWMAVMTLVFLLLSMKDYSPVGFLYRLLAGNVPFVNTIFRFGDTKFHALIAFGGSIVSAALMVRLLTLKMRIENIKISRLFLVIPVVGLLLASHVFVYRFYFNGNFVGFFMYQKIPDAYFEMAEIINSDTEMMRVVHMPLDKQAYWKPYSWGYFGSSFMHFMLNKPLFDRSFEPASMESADIHQQLMEVVNMAQYVPDDAKLEERASKLIDLLASLSVKYVIDDGTVTPEVKSRNIRYWGDIDGADSRRVFEYLEKTGRLELMNEYKVNAQELARDYSTLYPYSSRTGFMVQEPQTIRLYVLANYKPRVELVSELDIVHTSQQLSLDDKTTLGENYIQAIQLDERAIIYPFSSSETQLDSGNNSVQLQLPLSLDSGEYVMESDISRVDKKTEQYSVYLSADENVIMVHLELLPFPSISGVEAEVGSEIIINFNNEYDDYGFVRIGDVVLPLENVSGQNKVYIGSVILRDWETEIGLLRKSNEYNLSQSLVQLEVNPQCMDDALGEQDSRITGDEGILVIAGKNVSNCLTTYVALNNPERTTFSVLEFESSGTVNDLTGKADVDTGKPALGDYIESRVNPLLMEICFLRDQENRCLGKTNTFELNDEATKYVVPLVADLSNTENLLVGFRVRNGQKQEYETITTNIKLNTYVEPETFIYTRSVQPMTEQRYLIDKSETLKLSFPLATASYTKQFDVNLGGVRFGNDINCYDVGKDQAIKQGESGILMYVVGCRNFARQRINFSSDNFYLWQSNFKHLSGGLPTFFLMDSQKEYFFQKLLPNRNANDIFEIPLQHPESNEAENLDIGGVIRQTPPYNLHGFVEPVFDVSDEEEKEMIFQFHSQNAGLVELGNLSLIELPNYWSGSRIRPGNYEPLRLDGRAELSEVTRLLPSLWKMEIESPESLESMVLFNEQFDTQWRLFGADVMLHARCNSYVNCYQVKLLEGENTLYLFYMPQLLTWIGMLVAIIAGIGGWLYFMRRVVDADIKEQGSNRYLPLLNQSPNSRLQFVLVTSLALILIFVIYNRFTGLTDSPPGFYKDEAAMTVNGYSILKTGKDEFGISWPVFFRSFDDWKDPIFIYSQLPVLKLLGYDILSTRVTSALWGIITVLVFGYLVWLRFKKPWAVLLSLLIFGLLPWHFHFSRIGFQLITLPFFISVYLIFLHKWLDTNKTRWFIGSAVVLGLTFYTYYSARFLIFLLYFLQNILFLNKFRPKRFIYGSLVFLACLVPVVIWSIYYPESLISRYQHVTFLSESKSIFDSIVRYFSGYIANYLPIFWLHEGDSHLRHSVQFHHPLLWITFPLLLVGFIAMVKNIKDDFNKYILALFLTFPLLSALTHGAPHVHRTIHIVPIVVYMMVVGAKSSYEWLNKRVSGTQLKLMSSLFIVLFVVEWFVFRNYYFNDYKDKAQAWFLVPDIEAIEALFTYPAPHIVSSNVAEYHWSTYQLVGKLDPEKIQNNLTGVSFVNLETFERFEKGYYLLKGQECEEFAEKVLLSILVDTSVEGFCIYSVE